MAKVRRIEFTGGPMDGTVTEDAEDVAFFCDATTGGVGTAYCCSGHWYVLGSGGEGVMVLKHAGCGDKPEGW